MAQPLLLLAPLLYGLAAILMQAGSPFRPRWRLRLSGWLAGLALLAAVLSLVFVLRGGSQAMLSVSVAGIPLGIRPDLPGALMLVMVTFIGWVVTRYSATYLDGERNQGYFASWMHLTLAAVLTFLVAGTLPLLVASFIATSLCLNRLLLFYPERPGARRAARKKFLFSRLADGALIAAALLLSHGYGTSDIAAILTAAKAGLAPAGTGVAIGLLAFAALLKSAQFPAHGWLVEVMETPTPVSALLHAGLVNAGGFLLIRFADLLLLSPAVLAILAMIGAFTALFGALVMLTQSAVKTALAWSTIAQMGFMILQCGLGLFPVALLHIIAHSLYKAHAFLTSGSAVEAVHAVRKPGPVAIPGFAAVARSFLLALVIYAAAGLLFGFWEKPVQALALGAILIFGIAYLLAQGLADTAPKALTWRISLYALSASLGYFALQWAAYRLMAGVMPLPPQPGPLEWAVILLAVTTFGFVAFIQSLFPVWSLHPAAAGLRVHLLNGLYVNALLDRLLGHFRLSTQLQTKE